MYGAQRRTSSCAQGAGARLTAFGQISVKRKQGAASSAYVPAIDGLRSVAVLLVMLFHLYAPAMPGGFAGVDVFYVISGFVVTKSLMGKEFKSLVDLITYFYVRRVLRIMPALLLTLLVSVMLYVAFVPESWLSSETPRVAKAAFFGVSNIVLALNTDNYFAPRPAFNPFTHTWSLGVEEQFYLIFPFFLYWYAKFPRWAFRGLVFASLLSLALCGVLSAINWQFAFYLMPARFWELGLGMSLCLSFATWQAKLSRAPRTLQNGFLAGSLVLLAATLPIPSSPRFPFPLALAPVLGTGGLIAYVCAFPNSRCARALSSALPVAVGRRSYSLYLWHWPIFVLLRWTAGLETLPTMAAGIVLTFVAGELSYRYVELGGRRRHIASAYPRKLILGLAAAALATSAAAGSVALKLQRQLSLSTTARGTDWYPDYSKPLDTRWSHCPVREHEKAFAGAIARSWLPYCSGPAPGGRLWVIGDSHALAYIPLLTQYAADTGRRVSLYHLSGCAFINLTETLGQTPECTNYYRALMTMLWRDARAGDVVFLASLKMPRLSEQAGGEPMNGAAAEDGRTSQVAAREALGFARLLQGKGVQLVFEAPKPVFRSPPYRCSDWFNRSNPACKGGFEIRRSELEPARQHTLAPMHAIAASQRNVHVWDPFPALCPAETCDAFRAGRPLFFDGDHISGFANEFLYPQFRGQMEQAFHGSKLP